MAEKALIAGLARMTQKVQPCLPITISRRKASVPPAQPPVVTRVSLITACRTAERDPATSAAHVGRRTG